MNLRVNWKKLSVSLLLMVLAFGSFEVYRVFSSPSGQTSSIEGGGFCSSDFTVYNNTVDNKLYGMNCNTGVNDVSASTDLGATVNTLYGELAALKRAGEVDLRSGFFSVVTPIIMSHGTPCYNGAIVIQCSGFTLKGSGEGGTLPASSNATMLVAKTGGMNMIESTATPSSSAPAVWGTRIMDLMLVANGLAANGINLAMTETGGANNLVENVKVTEFNSQNPGCSGGFTNAGIIMDGSEDSQLINVHVDGDGQTGANHCSPPISVQWIDGNGDANIVSSLMNGATDCYCSGQTINILGSTISSVKLAGNTRVIEFTNDYICNTAPSAVARIKLNGFTLEDLSITSSCVETDSTVQDFYANAGTVSVFSTRGCDWNFPSGTNVWNANSATLTKQVSDGANHIHSNSSPPTGFPFSVDGNSNF